MRRSLPQLESALLAAKTHAQKARAHYHLALFHDNNGREPLAIPHYRRALRLGLDAKHTAEARAWLASSLHKTGRPLQARKHLHTARQRALTHPLKRFLS